MNLKKFSRIEEVKSTQDIDINESVRSALAIVKNDIKDKADIKEDYGEIPFVKCNGQEMNQVFLNLLVNAAHAMEKTNKGQIIIKTWAGDNKIFVSVSDTGSGILPENVERIFEPFFTTKEAGKGTGLGLSISYDIVKKAGGNITVTSQAGSGATFLVELPEIMVGQESM